MLFWPGPRRGIKSTCRRCWNIFSTERKKKKKAQDEWKCMQKEEEKERTFLLLLFTLSQHFQHKNKTCFTGIYRKTTSWKQNSERNIVTRKSRTNMSKTCATQQQHSFFTLLRLRNLEFLSKHNMLERENAIRLSPSALHSTSKCWNE